ncbi:hypothetical protein BZA05DRAFT_332021, partial [Tricharina praecox]|uniref:uncharacterized protein n=1 Tax=Tricharina praecox TaxID=43433 RepID=UPI00221F7D70
MTEGILDGKKGKDWKIQVGGEEIVMRDIGIKVLLWVDRFKEIGDIIVQYDPGHAALPWAGFRFLLKLCLDKQETAEAILVGLEKTACIIDRCAIYEFLYLDEATAGSVNLEKSMLRLYTAILKFLAKAIKRSKGEYPYRSFTINVATNHFITADSHIKAVFTTGETSNYLNEVKDLEETVERDAAVAETQCMLSGHANLRALLGDINITTSRLGLQIYAIQEKIEGSRRSEILGWVSTIPYLDHHNLITNARVEGTGDWLFRKREYSDWRSSSVSKLLLLRGIPGAGKTYIASRVIDSFRDSTPERLAYFYCNRAEENRRHPESILNTLVQQLTQTFEDNTLLKPVVDLYEDRTKKGQTSSRLCLSESQELLVQLTDIYPRTTICIDALDEVEKGVRLHLLKALRYVVERSKNLVKIFATTRMDPDIVRQFEMFPRIELQPDDNASDINQFVETKLQETIKYGLLLGGEVDQEFKKEICEALCERSKGMFQLAALHITSLCDMSTHKDVRCSLKALPKTLKDAYTEIYSRILAQDGSAPRLAINAFRWIQSSYEPMGSESLLDAITAEVSSSGEFSHDTVHASVLLKACHNLIILDEGLNVFRFAHLSVDEYLETQ